MKAITSLSLAAACLLLFSAADHAKEKYRCLPCGLDCDKATFDKPGTCPECQMSLVKASSITFKNIEPADVCAYIGAHPETVLLDVRTRQEFEKKSTPDFGVLKNAVNIPLQELEARMAELEALKSRQIIVYCSHSHRSPQASYILTQNGFRRVTNMSGGMSKLSKGSCKE